MILDALAHQSKLLAALVEDAGATGDPDLAAHVAALLPRIVAARALAVGLAQRPLVASPSYPWRPRYEAAEGRLGVGLGLAIVQARAVEAGRNPLGIEDDDLPLYFLDDAPSAGGRFAAASDFLLGNGPGSRAWAPALVAQAQSALTSARDHRRWVENVRDD